MGTEHYLFQFPISFLIPALSTLCLFPYALFIPTLYLLSSLYLLIISVSCFCLVVYFGGGGIIKVSMILIVLAIFFYRFANFDVCCDLKPNLWAPAWSPPTIPSGQHTEKNKELQQKHMMENWKTTFNFFMQIISNLWQNVLEHVD